MATTPSYFPLFPTPYAVASPHHTQIHGGYHYPHPAAAYPLPPPGFVPVPANTTPIHHHRPGFVPSPAYMPPPAPAYAPPPPVPYPPPAQAYGPFGYYPAAATPSTAAPLAVAATPHANFSFPSTAENSDLVFHRATPEFRCQDSKTEEDGSAPPRQDFALHTEKSGSATACKDCALLVEPVLNAPTIQSAEAQAQAEETISKDVPRAVRDLKRRLDAQLARDRTSFDTIKGELAKLTSMASQFALSISKQTNSAIPTSSSLRVTGTAPVASKVFDTMPTSSSGCSKVFGKQSSAAASSPTTSGNSRFGASCSTYAAPQVFGETPTSRLWQGTHGSVPDCCSGRRNLSLSACVSNISEHSYYALPGNYPLEQDMPEPLLSNKSVGVSDSTPEQQPCKEHTIKAQNGTEVVVKCNSWLTTPLQSIGDQVKGLNTLSLTTPWDPGAAASLETTLSPASVAAQVAQSTQVLCPRVDITAVFESLLVPNLKLSSNVQDDSHVFKETAVYDTDEKDASASRRCLHRSVDIIEAVTEEVEVKVDSGKRIISPARPTDGVFSSTNENNSESELPAVCFNIVSDNAFNEQGRAIWDPGASTSFYSSKAELLGNQVETHVQQLRNPCWNVLVASEKREWDPGDTTFYALFMTADSATKLQRTNVYKPAVVQILDVQFGVRRALIFKSAVMRCDAFGLARTKVNGSALFVLVVPGSTDTSCSSPSFENMAKLLWDPGIGISYYMYLWPEMRAVKMLGKTAVPNLVHSGQTPCNLRNFLGHPVDLKQIEAYCPSNIGFVLQQGVHENYSAKQLLLYSQKYLQIKEMDIIFITHLPP